MVDFLRSYGQEAGVGLAVSVLLWLLGKYLPTKKMDAALRWIDAALGKAVTTITDRILGGFCFAIGKRLSTFLLSFMNRKTAEKFETGALVSLATWLESAALIVTNRITELVGVLPVCFRRIREGLLSDNRN